MKFEDAMLINDNEVLKVLFLNNLFKHILMLIKSEKIIIQLRIQMNVLR